MFKIKKNTFSFIIATGILGMGFVFKIKNQDATVPLSPKEAQKSFRLPEGFRIELVAAEPLIQEPTAVCWDEHGQLYVSELHGYNLEGQLEIDEINKMGVIDTLVRRVQAEDKYKKAAEAGTYGTIKKLIDTNGDGEMDKAITFADHIAPAYGLCAARGGIIVAGQTKIIYLADNDKDGKAEVQETLFEGFEEGVLERGLNAPQWGPDGWIYVGRGWNGGEITGKHLAKPVKLAGSNFRIRADGSAIEEITGSTHTIGHAFTSGGESFFTNTWKHALYAAPIQWKYLLRNPDAPIGSLEGDASDYSTVYPLAPVHPWKLARSNQEEWRKYYDRYGLAESAAGGYFTSSCSPMIYQDNLFPAEYRNNLFVCEPAQCLIHRCLVSEQGTGLKVTRAESEQKSEFLASTDSWFRPVSVVSAFDGSLYVADMYREIIEDYSAVPRFMQQKYGLKNGVNHGRIWRISPKTAKPLSRLKFKDFAKSNLEKGLDSPHYWERQTADRLLREQQGNMAPAIVKRQFPITQITAQTPVSVFVNTLRREDHALITDPSLSDKLAAISYQITNERMLLQLALSLGYSQDATVLAALTNMARHHAQIRWMPDALLTGVHQRAGKMLGSLLQNTGKTGNLLLEPLAASIAARADAGELNDLLETLENCPSINSVVATLQGLNKNLKTVELTENTRKIINTWLQNPDIALRGQAVTLAIKLNLGDSQVLEDLQQQAIADIKNPKLADENRLAAINFLTDAPDKVAGKALSEALKISSPPLQSAILEALISKGNRLSYLLDALESESILPSVLLSSQRTKLLERADGNLRPRFESVFAKIIIPNKEVIYAEYATALQQKPDFQQGKILFTQMCSACHQIKNEGKIVGPDLKNSYANSSETILRNILFPSEKIASSYETYTITTLDNNTFTGVMVSETANALMLKQIGGAEQTFLRKNIKNLSHSNTSLMPEYAQALSPKNCADIIGWIKEELGTK